MLPLKEFKTARWSLTRKIMEEYDQWNDYVYDQVIKYTDIVHKSKEP